MLRNAMVRAIIVDAILHLDRPRVNLLIFQIHLRARARAKASSVLLCYKLVMIRLRLDNFRVRSPNRCDVFNRSQRRTARRANYNRSARMTLNSDSVPYFLQK